jgi:serine/threonine protein kinase
VKRQAELLFHELADLNPTQREQFFAEHQVSPEVRSEVEALLSFDSNNEHVLTESVMAVAEQSFNAMREGSRCGAYRLMRLLGRGGMGSVYLAERADGELHHSVAIKLLRYGADELSFHDRFLRERQILASLNHPGSQAVGCRTNQRRPTLPGDGIHRRQAH